MDITGVLPMSTEEPILQPSGRPEPLLTPTGTSYNFTSVGYTGQALVSGGTGIPTWTTGTLALDGNFKPFPEPMPLP